DPRLLLRDAPRRPGHRRVDRPWGCGVSTSEPEGPSFFLVDQLPWPDEARGSAPRELVEEARRKGARRKFLARGQGGFHSQYSDFSAGYTVPPHSHDHDEMIVVLAVSCTILGRVRSLKSYESRVLLGGN